MRSAAQRVRDGVRGILQAYGTSRIKRHLWNGEFASGRWDQTARADADFADAVVEQYADGGSILDLGCGAGRSAHALDGARYRSYTGVDISDVAVETASRAAARDNRADRCRFARADISSYVPLERHDVILFMESLYYVPRNRMTATLDRYAAHLTATGVFIARIWTGTGKYLPLVRLIGREFCVVDERWSDDPKAVLLVFRPRIGGGREA
jgi:SAM-dependent methyltransferase